MTRKFKYYCSDQKILRSLAADFLYYYKNSTTILITDLVSKMYYLIYIATCAKEHYTTTNLKNGRVYLVEYIK